MTEECAVLKFLKFFIFSFLIFFGFFGFFWLGTCFIQHEIRNEENREVGGAVLSTFYCGFEILYFFLK